MDLSVQLTIAGLVLGLPVTYLAWHQLFRMPSKARQQILDRLGDLPLDPATLESKFSLPKKYLWKSVAVLYKQRKVDIAITEGVIETDHPDIDPGTKAILPMIKRGLYSPDNRAAEHMALEILASLQNG